MSIENFIKNADRIMIMYYGVNNTTLMYLHNVMCSGGGVNFTENGSDMVYLDEHLGCISLFAPIEYDRFDLMQKTVISKIKRNFDTNLSSIKLIGDIKFGGSMTTAIIDQINFELNEFKTHCYGELPTADNFTVDHFKDCIKQINQEYQKYYGKVWVPYPGTGNGMKMTENTPKWLVFSVHNMCVAILETRKSPYFFRRNKKKYMQYEHIEYSYKCIEKLKAHCEKLLGI